MTDETGTQIVQGDPEQRGFSQGELSEPQQTSFESLLQGGTSWGRTVPAATLSDGIAKTSPPFPSKGRPLPKEGDGSFAYQAEVPRGASRSFTPQPSPWISPYSPYGGGAHPGFFVPASPILAPGTPLLVPYQPAVPPLLSSPPVAAPNTEEYHPPPEDEDDQDYSHSSYVLRNTPEQLQSGSWEGAAVPETAEFRSDQHDGDTLIRQEREGITQPVRYAYFPNLQRRQTVAFKPTSDWAAAAVANAEAFRQSPREYHNAVLENALLRRTLRTLGRAVEKYAQEQFATMQPGRRGTKTTKRTVEEDVFQVVCEKPPDRGLNVMVSECHGDTGGWYVVKNETTSQGRTRKEREKQQQRNARKQLLYQQDQLQREKERLWRRFCFQLEDAGAEAKARGLLRHPPLTHWRA